MLTFPGRSSAARASGVVLATLASLFVAESARADDPTLAPAATTPPKAPDFPPCILGTTSCGGHWAFIPDSPPAAPAAPPVLGPRGPVYEHANTWDLNIEGAFGRYLGDSPTWTGFVRARAGALFIREPLYDALGFTYEYSSLSKGTFGIQGEVLHLELGVWGQVGGLLDVSGHPGVMGALGWSILGVEAQYRTYDDRGSGVAIYAKLRIPVSIIARLFKEKPGAAATK